MRVWTLALGGFLAGTLIALLMVLIEHSQIAFNSYALFGNGALIVPALLAPFAIYPGWVWTQRHGGRALELALFVVGLHFGVGMLSVLEVVLSPADTNLGLADALPGFLFSGSVFVLPAGLVAGAALWIGGRVRGLSAINLVLNRTQILGTTADFDLTPAVVEVLNKALPSVVVPPDGVSPLAMAPHTTAPGAATAPGTAPVSATAAAAPAKPPQKH